MKEPVRVLVVDDSALMRKLIPKILEADGSIKVVGTAMDGTFGLKKIEELKPQVLTLDLEMPRMNGLEMLREITRRHRLPVIVFSALSRDGARETLQALALGAFDFVAKPETAAAGRLEEISQELLIKIKAAAVAGFPKMLIEVPPLQGKREFAKPKSLPRRAPTRVVAIGVSTGGPNALQYMLSKFPPDFAGCLLVVQHMPEGFTEMLAKRLDESSMLEVREARSGELLRAGQVLVCPGNRHMLVRRTAEGHIAVLSDTAKVSGHRPSADVLFRSMAKEFGSQAVALLMTGMGDDGVNAIGMVKAAGGLTLAQDSHSCVVDSMPRSAVERGHISRVLALESIPNFLYAQCAGEPVGAVHGGTADEARQEEKSAVGHRKDF